MIRTVLASLPLLILIGCFYLKEPGSAPKEPTVRPDGAVVPVPFDYNTLVYYLITIAAAIRWAIVEWKHRALIKAGKKDDNRDGEEDKT